LVNRRWQAYRDALRLWFSIRAKNEKEIYQNLSGGHPMKTLFSSLSAASLLSVGLLLTTNVYAQDARIEAPAPRTEAAPFRLTPVLGSSSFTTSDRVNADGFSNLSGGVFADFGAHTWTFETGVLSLQSNATSNNNGNASVNVATWGVPLLARVNFSGKPHETIFLKAGGMPFKATGTSNDDIQVLGVAGIGGNIPLGQNSSLLLDASYNRRLSDNGDLNRYQGVALLAGLAFNL
jgi:hypothetical protein